MFIGEHALWSRHVPVFTARHSALLCVALHCLSDLTSPHSPSGSLGASLTGLPALLFSRRAGRPVTCSGPLHSLFPLPRLLCYYSVPDWLLLILQGSVSMSFPLMTTLLLLSQEPFFYELYHNSNLYLFICVILPPP